MAAPPPGWRLALAGLLLPMAWASYDPDMSPLPRAMSFVRTPDQLIAELPCIERYDLVIPFQPAERKAEPLQLKHLLSCPPSLGVIRWVEANVPVNGVFAINKLYEYSPSAFMPQQIAVWASPAATFLNEESFFATYYEQYHRSLAAYGQQPFFNDRETPEERGNYIRALGVTHVLVDPETRDMMMRTLAQYPDLFARRYDDGRWAVWEIRSS